jgi:hypothetical protein
MFVVLLTLNIADGNRPRNIHASVVVMFFACIAIATTAWSQGFTHEWSARYGAGDHQRGIGIATDTASNVCITGYFRNTVDFGGGVLTSAGGYDVFLAKLNPAGGHLWSQRFGDGNAEQWAQDIAVDDAGNIVIAGYRPLGQSRLEPTLRRRRRPKGLRNFSGCIW